MNGNASASDGFRARCDPIWRALHEHPFINELAAGTLPLEKFRFFLEQDNFYLEEYARCLAMGAAKSRTEAELRYFTTDLNQVLDAELPSNRALLERVIEMGAADRGGSPRDGAGQRRVHQLHAVRSRFAEARSRSWRRCSRARGATWRSPPTSAARTDLDHPVYGGWVALLQSAVERRDGRRRCAATSTHSCARRPAPTAGATRSGGSSPRARGWSGGSGRWRTPWSSGRISAG